MSSEFDLKDFRSDVVEESKKRPVVIDFWAEWCGPCKVLGPTIEKLAKEAKGRWRLVKIDTEAHQQLAAQFGIRSIPSVKMVFEGKLVGEFNGALPEPAIRKWLEEHLPPMPEQAAGIEEAHKLLQEGNREGAFEIVKNLFIESPENEDFRLLLGLMLMPTELDEAERILSPLAKLPKYTFEIEAIATLRELNSYATNEKSLSTEGHPKTIEAVKNGILAFENHQFSDALDFFIRSLMLDKSYQNEFARKACVAIFKLLTEFHPITKAKRRAFSMALT